MKACTVKLNGNLPLIEDYIEADSIFGGPIAFINFDMNVWHRRVHNFRFDGYTARNTGNPMKIVECYSISYSTEKYEETIQSRPGDDQAIVRISYKRSEKCLKDINFEPNCKIVIGQPRFLTHSWCHEVPPCGVSSYVLEDTFWLMMEGDGLLVNYDDYADSWSFVYWDPADGKIKELFSASQKNPQRDEMDAEAAELVKTA